MTTPSLTTLVRRAIDRHALIARGDLVLAAVSGGPDSMAMLDALALSRRRVKFVLFACAVDHGLREVEAELAIVADQCRAREVPLSIARVEVARGSNLMSRARDARRAALVEVAARVRARAIATAHHADDRAETVLLRLLSGSGPRGLACLPPRDGPWIRPLCLATRADVDAHLARHRVPFSTDPSNVEPRFARARVRSQVLPLLRELSPAIVAHLNDLADDLARLPEPSWPRALGRKHRRMVEGAGRRVVVRTRDGDRWVSLDAGGFVVTKTDDAEEGAQD